MPEALAAVKREFGPDAVILGTRYLPSSGLQGWANRRRVEVTAAPGSTLTPAPRLRKPADDGAEFRPLVVPAAVPAAPRAAAPVTPSGPPATPDVLPKDLYRHYVHLVQNEVSAEIAEQIVRQATSGLAPGRGHNEAAVRAALRDYIVRMLPAEPTPSPTPGTMRSLALVGPAGSGKSTTIVKLAALQRLRHKQRVALLSLDMHRMAAHAQLQRYAEVLDIPIHTAQTVGEVRQAVRALDGVDLLLIDTPGVGVREQARFARVAALLRAARPTELHLVLPASLDPAVQTRIAQGFAPLGVSRVVLTHLDEVVGLGVVLNVVSRLHLEVSYLTAGQNIPNDIEESCGARVAEALSGAAE